MESTRGQSTSPRRRTKKLTKAETALTYAERLEILESVLVIVQSSTQVLFRQNGNDLEIKIINAKLKDDTIVPA